MNVAWGAQLNICTDITLLGNSPEQVLWLGPRTVSGVSGGIATPPGSASGALAGSQSEAQGYAGPVTYHEATIAASDAGASGTTSRVSAGLQSA